VNDKQRARLANILTNVGQIIFAVSIIAPFFQGAQVSPVTMVVGLSVTFVSFIIALLIEKGD